MPFQLCFIVEERRAHVARVVTSRCNLSFDRDSVSSKMMIKLRDRVKLLRALAAHVLLNLVMRFHVIVEISDLSKRSAAVHLDAHERSFARMKSSVVVQVGDLCESFGAIDAKIIKD